MEIGLPQDLMNDRESIEDDFRKIKADYNPEIDALILEDKYFTRRIIKFMNDVLSYMIENYDEINIKEYQDFLGFYHLNFTYDEDMNYLDQEPVEEFCFSLRDNSSQASMSDLREIRDKFEKILEIN
jgi:hypothetical protein